MGRVSEKIHFLFCILLFLKLFFRFDIMKYAHEVPFQTSRTIYFSNTRFILKITLESTFFSVLRDRVFIIGCDLRVFKNLLHRSVGFESVFEIVSIKRFFTVLCVKGKLNYSLLDNESRKVYKKYTYGTYLYRYAIIKQVSFIFRKFGKNGFENELFQYFWKLIFLFKLS